MTTDWDAETSGTMLFGVKAGAVLILFDLIASLLSRYAHIPYASFTLGSFAIYVVAGFLAARRFRFAAAPLVGTVAGLSEATVGWAVSWVIGPGRPSASAAGFVSILFAGVVVTAVATGLGALGGVGAVLMSKS